MLIFVKKAFRKFFEIWLWLNLALCATGGGALFYFTVAQSRCDWSGRVVEVNGGLVFLGVVIGLAVGFINNILAGGLIATFLNIDDNLEQLKNHTGSPV